MFFVSSLDQNLRGVLIVLPKDSIIQDEVLYLDTIVFVSEFTT